MNLNKPRYIVTAAWPNGLTPGTIIENEGLLKEYNVNQFPDLFKCLDWWEYRAPEEMPKRVALMATPPGGSYYIPGDVLTIHHWDFSHQNGWEATIQEPNGKAGRKYFVSFLKPIYDEA